MNGATAYIAAIGYVLFLFLIAWWGDRGGRRFIAGGPRTVVYALSLAVYCTSWTYYGSVGLASSHGLDFLPIYIGPILVIGLGSAFVARIANLARSQNLTTVADFVSARYGKSPKVAAVAALIALIGSAPYVALQLKAVSTTLLTVVASFDRSGLVANRPSAPFSLAIAFVLAGFAVAFGTRRLNPKERQDGLILAIAVEAIVKLVAFLAVGAFVVWGMSGGVAGLTQTALSNPKIAAVVQTLPDPAVWSVTTLLSAFAILLLPRQFHVAVVENHDRREIRTASWLFPAYLVLINLFVAPLAIAGLKMFPDGAINRDLTVLALPLAAHAPFLALITMIGGLSAATGMIVVDSLALAITVSNDLVMPLLLRRRAIPTQPAAGDIGALALWVRRLSIFGVLALGFAYERLTSETALVSIGLLSFAALAQIAPAFLGGLFWRRGTGRGALGGMWAGSLAWLYLLLLPSLGSHATIAAYLAHGPLAIAWLSPAALTAFAPSPLVGGVVVSLAVNLAAFVGFSLMRQPTALERAQANAFAGGAGGKPQAFRLWRSSTTAGELEAAVARYLGAARARRAFAAFMRERGQDYDPAREASAQLIRHAEFLLSPAIGASTSRQVLSLLLRPRAVSGESALKLIDEASAAIQSSRDQLQHALDHARQGVTVFDSNLALTAWNREFVDLFDLPQALLRHGVGLDEIVRFNAARGAYGPGDNEDFVAERVASLLYDDQPTRLRLFSTHRVIEIRSARLPDGGIVTTYTDITQTVQTEEALEAANEFLEKRVDERTAELQRLNAELASAKTVAEEANLSKTRFLAAASHDILQPLNAARLYASSLAEGAARAGDDRADLARKVDMSLEAVEEILGALLDISRLDAGATKPEVSDTPVADLLRMVEVEFSPLARSKGLELRFVPTRLAIRTDRRLMRRLLQNLVSNAIKYTVRGKVLVGCRRRGNALRIEVWDTGLGIPADRQRVVFEEFQRLDQGARIARGLGLGLSIVERLGRVLDHHVGLKSRLGEGSVFHVTAPLGAAAPARADDAAAPQAPAADEPLSGLRVLAIDNEPRVLDGMRALLGRWGCVVVTANGLAEAREALSGFGAPDLIIADYHLDKGDGIAAILTLRKELARPIPAILATADRSPEARDEAARRDIVILHKPVKPAPLRAQLARISALREAAE
jgi:Na+/proline symporter/signal transduction histidine kinase